MRGASQLRAAFSATTLALLVALQPGCSVFEVVSAWPDFSVSGARVAVLPFAGPENWWYGEHPVTNTLHSMATSIVREGGAEICRSNQLFRELMDFTEDREPPWIEYGKRLRADYVVVASLLTWDMDRRSAVGYAAGQASMDLQVYDVAKGSIAFQKRFDASVGMDPDSTDIYHDHASGERALIRELMRTWKAIFVGGADDS